jgi:hypothetical protein
MNNDLLDLYFFSDEAWFHLSGYVNSQNMRMWSAENDFFFKNRNYTLKKLDCGCLIGPVLFEKSVTEVRYKRICHGSKISFRSFFVFLRIWPEWKAHGFH